jgi:GDP-L-fucose synthase
MKTVLITGCAGLVGNYLIKKFLDEGFKVIGVDINKVFNDNENFILEQLDLTKDSNIEKLFECYDFELVVNAFGIKGSPIRAKTKPVDFLYPSFIINTEIINQCAKRDIWLVFMSSVGVYAPAEKFVESDVWKTLPSEHDWFPSWSKRTGELLLEAYKIQYDYKKWSIIRPANIFGEYDDFSGNGTVISSTIKKIWESKDTIECWGDGSPTRDFVYGEDVADAIYKLYTNQINETINFGSGEEITIKSMIESLIMISGKEIKIKWDSTKPNGDLRRQMDVTKQKQFDLLPNTSFVDALQKTYTHYKTKF